MPETDPAFTVSPDPVPTYILLGLSCAAFLLSLVHIFFDRNNKHQQEEHHHTAYDNLSTSTFVHSNDTTRQSARPESSTIPTREGTRQSTLISSASDARQPVESHQSENGNDEEDTRPRPKRPPGAIKALLLTLLARLFFCAALLGTMALGIYLLVPTLNKNALHVLADDRTNRWLHKLMQRAVLQYAQSANRPDLAAPTTRIGVGEHVMEPDSIYYPIKWRWVMFFVVFVFFIVIGVGLRLARGLYPSKRSVTFVTLAQLLFWFCISLIIAYAFPRDFPFQGQPLRNYWLDRNYSTSLNSLDETRLISNFYVSTVSTDGDKTVTNLNDLPDFFFSFCTQYFQLTPTTEDTYPPSDPSVSAEPANEPVAEQNPEENQELVSDENNFAESTQEPSSTPQVIPVRTSRGYTYENAETMPQERLKQKAADPASIVVSDLPLKLYNEVFSVYLVGKPMGTDVFRAMAYMALPFLVVSPIVATYMLHSYLLYPFFALWVTTLVILAVFGTPSVLRVITAPVDQKGIVSFCRLNYRIQVLDHTTRMIARMDLAIFVITILVVILQSLRWLKEPDFVAKQKWPEPRRVHFEQVYQRWSPSQR